MKSLGKRQREVLRNLCEYKRWSNRGIFSGWVWDSPGNTQKILDTLVGRGLAALKGGTYTPTKEGREVNNDDKSI